MLKSANPYVPYVAYVAPPLPSTPRSPDVPRPSSIRSKSRERRQIFDREEPRTRERQILDEISKSVHPRD
jgi:hypothetical protein